MRWTNELIDSFLIKNNRKIQRIQNYIGCQKKILWKCLIDQHEWVCTPTHILNDDVGCPKCAGNVKLNNDDIDKKLIGRNIKRLGEYNGTNHSINWQCLNCNYKWVQKPDHILNTGSGCPNCANINSRVGEVDIIQRLKLRNISLGSNITSNRYNFKCDICNYEWKTNLNHVLWIGTGCRRCSTKINADKMRSSKEDVIRKIEKRDMKYIFGDYISCKSKLTVSCNKCNNIWSTSAGNLMHATGCPCCLYKRELYVKKLLESFGLSFKHHKKFFIPQLVIVDFHAPDKNMIIEYNGEQHYKAVKHFGGNPKFIKQQIRDNRLRTYCIENKIKLLEIPYWLSDKEIEETVKDFINR